MSRHRAGVQRDARACPLWPKPLVTIHNFVPERVANFLPLTLVVRKFFRLARCTRCLLPDTFRLLQQSRFRLLFEAARRLHCYRSADKRLMSTKHILIVLGAALLIGTQHPRSTA